MAVLLCWLSQKDKSFGLFCLFSIFTYDKRQKKIYLRGIVIDTTQCSLACFPDEMAFFKKSMQKGVRTYIIFKTTECTYYVLPSSIIKAFSTVDIKSLASQNIFVI